jgi:spore maturation protein CgeB
VKILVVGPQFPDSFAYSIAVNFMAMGHDVKAVDGIRAAHHRSRAAAWVRRNLSRALPRVEMANFRRVIDSAREHQPDLVVVGFATMPPQIVAELKNVTGATLACWYADAIVNLDRQYLFASPFDAVFTKEPFLVRMLIDKLGVQAHYLPEACNPLAYERRSLTADDQKKFGCDLAAMGTLHYYRARMLDLFDGYDLKIWGKNCPPWLSSSMKKYYAHSYVTEKEKAKALLAAKIVLNNINCMEVEGVNGALFQIAGCGAFQIADWKPTLPALFEPEREIVTFRTRAELKEKVDYYLARPIERSEIADRAYIRARKEHTYQNRLETMLEILGLAEKKIDPSEKLVMATTA